MINGYEDKSGVFKILDDDPAPDLKFQREVVIEISSVIYSVICCVTTCAMTALIWHDKSHEIQIFVMIITVQWLICEYGPQT